MNDTITPETTFVVPPQSQEVVVTRVFDSSPEVIFGVLIDPDAVKDWWGPREYPTRVDEMDVRPGGRWRYVCGEGDGEEIGFHGFYHDVTAPERLVFTFEYEGVPGHVLLETVRLEDLGDGRTKLIDTSVYQSLADRDGMVEAGMEWGARQSMDRLAELLARKTAQAQRST
jgi:uncharacterized protein YndB with AHSA1/START domain